jgi:hypothetical protein
MEFETQVRILYFCIWNIVLLLDLQLCITSTAPIAPFNAFPERSAQSWYSP